MNRYLAVLFLTIFLAGPTPAAATPRDELLRLVPDDVGFCLVVQDLREHLAALADSPLAVAVKASPIAKVVGNAPEVAQLSAVEKILKEHLGTDFAQLRDDILGDAVVFAYRPGPPGKPEQDQGLVLIRARNAILLAGLVDRLNQLQLKLGELTRLEERQHNGTKYFSRVERNQPMTYYAVRGNVLFFAPHEPILKNALDLDRTAKPADAETPLLAKNLKQLGADKALLSLWINPRAFDAELKQKATTAPAGEAAFLKHFQTYWQALEGVALSVVLNKDLEVNVAARVRRESLSLTAQKFLSEAAKPSEVWNAVPRDALFAAATRIDMAALKELLMEFVDADTLRAMVANFDQQAGPTIGKTLRQLAPQLGPDVGFYVAAPPAGSKHWVPDVVWAARVQPGAPARPTEQTLHDMLNFFANLAVLEHNAKGGDRITLKSVQQDKVEVKYFANDRQFPAGFQPAFAVKDGWWLVGSSPEALGRFAPRSAPSMTADETPIARLSVAALRAYLKQHRDALTSAISEKNQIPRLEAATQLERLLTALQVIDAVDLIQRPSAGQVILTLRIKPSQPLRK